MARKVKSVKEKVETSKIKINPRYDANYAEMLELCSCDESLLDKVALAFRYGYIQGAKAFKAEKGASV